MSGKYISYFSPPVRLPRLLPFRGASEGVQRELCAAWHVPPQTVNSALKKLANQGLIALEPVPGNQKNKQILLTEKGLELSRQVILPLVQAEQTVFQELGEEPQAALLSLTQRYVTLLHTKLN